MARTHETGRTKRYALSRITQSGGDGVNQSQRATKRREHDGQIHAVDVAVEIAVTGR